MGSSENRYKNVAITETTVYAMFMDKIEDVNQWAKRQVRDFGSDRRDWMREVMADRDLEPKHKLVAIAIGLRMNHASETSWPSVKRIASDSCTSTRTVIRALAILTGEDGKEAKDGKPAKASMGKKYLKADRRKRGVNRYEMIMAPER